MKKEKEVSENYFLPVPGVGKNEGVLLPQGRGGTGHREPSRETNCPEPHQNV